MKKTTYALALCGAMSSAVLLSACGSSSSSGVVGNYDVGGCLNKVTLNLAHGESCVIAWGGNSYKNTCDALTDPANKTVNRVTTVIATGVVDPVIQSSNPWSYVRDAAASGSGGVGGNTLVSCI